MHSVAVKSVYFVLVENVCAKCERVIADPDCVEIKSSSESNHYKMNLDS